jgi:HAE1 family hydrophobic/amphiphilic exporter-1
MVRYTSTERDQPIDGIAISVTKQADANTLETVANVRAALRTIQAGFPPGAQVTVTNDASRFVRHSVDAVKKDLLLAILITGAILFLFLHTWRSTLIVLVSIPTCLVTTFLLMYILGFSFNTISLMAMALMIGILVDDSIVVLENTMRHLGLGENPIQAAIKGRGEIGLAAMAVTLTDVVVFVPISFMQGNVGKLFREFGLTIACATLLSLLVSFTLVPMLASRWLKAHEEDAHRRGFAGAWEGGFDRVAAMYRGLLRWALHHRPVIVGAAVVILAVSFLPLPLNLIGQEYAPREDDGQFTINTQMPPGTSLTSNSAAVSRVEQALINLPEVESFTTTVGGGGGGGNTRNGTIAVQLVEKSHRDRSVFNLMEEVRGATADIPGMQVRTSVQSPLIGGGGGSPINIRIVGNSSQTLTQIADQVEEILRNTPGTVEVVNNADAAQPEVRAVLNRQRMADLGVTASQVGTALRTAIGGTTVTQLQVEGQSAIDITVQANRDLRNDLTTLGSIPIPVGTTAGGAAAAPGAVSTVRLDQVAELRQVPAPTSIARSGRQRQVSLQAGLVDRTVGDAARDIRAQLARVPVPAGYRVQFAGQVDQLDQTRGALLSALAISVLLIYMLLVALYESWLDPLAIMFSLPVALTGAFGALLFSGNTFNLFSMIGMILLMGLVAKNGILLIDYTKTLRARGRDRLGALLEAGPTRLRPIVMTTAAMVFSMVPLAMKLEEGAESRAPMAIVLIGGLLTSTLLTLVLVPVMYTYLDDLARLPALARARVPRWLRLRRPRRPIPAMAGGSGDPSDPTPPPPGAR